MKYINATKGTLIALVIITGLVLFLPNLESIPILDVVLTVSTFLFAILVGFDLSRLFSRFTNVREFVAEEDARLLSF